jgi:hypothetical protein
MIADFWVGEWVATCQEGLGSSLRIVKEQVLGRAWGICHLLWVLWQELVVVNLWEEIVLCRGPDFDFQHGAWGDQPSPSSDYKSLSHTDWCSQSRSSLCCFVVASNSRHSTSSGFPNCPWPQLLQNLFHCCVLTWWLPSSRHVFRAVPKQWLSVLASSRHATMLSSNPVILSAPVHSAAQWRLA